MPCYFVKLPLLDADLTGNNEAKPIEKVWMNGWMSHFRGKDGWNAALGSLPQSCVIRLESASVIAHMMNQNYLIPTN